LRDGWKSASPASPARRLLLGAGALTSISEATTIKLKCEKGGKTSNRAQEELPALLEEAWQALRGQGDLARACSRFDHAARLAEAQGDVQALGEAALGAGGFWLYEQRSPVVRALVSGWRRRALAEVDPGSLLAVRLRVREAAERDYESGRTKAILAALL